VLINDSRRRFFRTCKSKRYIKSIKTSKNKVWKNKRYMGMDRKKI